MKAFVYDTRVGTNPLVDKLILENSRWLDIVVVETVNNSYTDRFRKLFRNYSPNSASFERVCFERYFYAYEKVSKVVSHTNEEFLLLDSDVRVLRSDFLQDLENGLVLSQCKNNDVKEPLLSPHCSKWNLILLKSFCDFILSFYLATDAELEAHYEEVQHATFRVSGISDMYLLYLFADKMEWANSNRVEIGILHNLYTDYIDSKVSKILGINMLSNKGVTHNKIQVVHFQGRLGKTLAKKAKITILHLVLLGILKKINEFLR